MYEKMSLKITDGVSLAPMEVVDSPQVGKKV